MSKDRSLVRASDIGQWTFCHRAWWLAQVKGLPHSNQAALDYGNAAHLAHGRAVQRASLYQQVGQWLILAAVVLGAFALFLWLR